MVPIHDTDVAEERWSKGEWENYELWEKVEQRLKRRRKFWILLTVLVFLGLSSVPTVMERWPKWRTRTFSRRLAQEINRLKKESIIDQSNYRLRLEAGGKLHFIVEKVAKCSEPKGLVVRSGTLLPTRLDEKYAWISTVRGIELGVPGLTQEVCFDYLKGLSGANISDTVLGFGIIPVNDLAENRLDRISVLLLTGVTGEASFD